MDITIQPNKLSGQVEAIPSKSQTHRLLICAAFADQDTRLICREVNRDIEATAECLNALGARVRRTADGYHVQPIRSYPAAAVLPCCESGSTLRFLLPIAGAMGVDALFRMEGRLPQRPLSPLWEEMERMGCRLSRPDSDTIRCTGQLRAGTYTIPGNVSSQYITGLLFALSLLKEPSRIDILGKLESEPYVTLTKKTMRQFGIDASPEHISGGSGYCSPGLVKTEGDWSNAAFFLAARELGNRITVTGLNPESTQGDKAVARLLPCMNENITISAADIPDLIPILSVFAAANQGAVFTDIHRLRIKESDRVASTIAMIRALGGRAEATENTLTVYGTGLTGGTVDSVNDHRIAMAAAIAATVCKNSVTILDAQCVQKSYPQFWAEYARLGGIYEQ